ncbi:MAG: hypothetical protein ACOYIO_03840 [Eubacteriales bacterium]|jgi:hypothetical protein
MRNTVHYIVIGLCILSLCLLANFAEAEDITQENNTATFTYYNN